MIKANPKVSVCVLTYNHEKYIRQCLQSIINQVTDFDIEVIVGDDCSTDASRAIIQEFVDKYPQIVKLIFHQTNIGACLNYLSVHQQALGEYIAHIDGDDYWFPYKLNEQISFMSEHPECVAVYSNAVVLNDNGELLGGFNNRLPEVFNLDFLMEKGNFLNHSSLFYSSAYRDEILNMEGNFLDYMIHLRLARRGLLGYVNKALVVYRRGAETSIVDNNFGFVCQLYWEAIMDVPPNAVSDKALRGAISTFSSKTIYAYIRRAQFGRVFYWVAKLFKESSINMSGAILLGVYRSFFEVLLVLMRKILAPICGKSLLRISCKR